MVIQGGMGVSVSNWRLARAVSKAGQLGVVSGTSLDLVLCRRLQDGDVDGSIRRAFDHFPLRDIAQQTFDRYFIDGGKDSSEPYKPLTMHSIDWNMSLLDLTVLANFTEVFLAKEGHDGLVGINYLMKIELPILPSLFGAMLAGVDYVLMGAGIPRAIPGILDRLSCHQPVELKLDVKDALPEDSFCLNFDPRLYVQESAPPLKRPKFLAVVSSSVLAQTLVKKANGKVDGFVVEHYSAGGHNAPPRGAQAVDTNGEPVYGVKDECKPEDFAKLGVPFWWAGSCASASKLQEALAVGAQGIQVGTAFAYCRESGIKDEFKQRVIEKVLNGQEDVFTDPRASASGYPFKVVQLEGSISEPQVFENRKRICDLGYLRMAYKRKDGSVGFRCPSEPVADYLKKGGSLEESVGRKCLCNGLISTIGHPQLQAGAYLEPPLLTAGKELSVISNFLPDGQTSYSAEDVLRVLLQTQRLDATKAISSCGDD